VQLREHVSQHHQVERLVAAAGGGLFPRTVLQARLRRKLLEPDMWLLLRSQGMREMHVQLSGLGKLQLAGEIVLKQDSG
jgi:hypothetical protein